MMRRQTFQIVIVQGMRSHSARDEEADISDSHSARDEEEHISDSHSAGMWREPQTLVGGVNRGEKQLHFLRNMCIHTKPKIMQLRLGKGKLARYS